MADVTMLLNRIHQGDAKATDELLPLVYEELRKLAAHRLNTKRGNSLQPTELVHEAYLRLVRDTEREAWDSRGHFFASAAEAMRRIIVDRIRRNLAQKRGEGIRHLELQEGLLSVEHPDRILAVHEALEEMEAEAPESATLVKLRYFVGMQHKEAAEAMGLTRRQADRLWLIAKAWLYKQLSDEEAIR